MVWNEEVLRDLARYMADLAGEVRPKAAVLRLVPRRERDALPVEIPEKATGTI